MKLTKDQIKEVVIRYVVAIVMLILVAIVLPGMFKRAKEDDKRLATEQSVVEQTTETEIESE